MRVVLEFPNVPDEAIPVILALAAEDLGREVPTTNAEKKAMMEDWVRFQWRVQHNSRRKGKLIQEARNAPDDPALDRL